MFSFIQTLFPLRSPEGKFIFNDRFSKAMTSYKETSLRSLKPDYLFDQNNFKVILKPKLALDQNTGLYYYIKPCVIHTKDDNKYEFYRLSKPELAKIAIMHEMRNPISPTPADVENMRDQITRQVRIKKANKEYRCDNIVDIVDIIESA